MARDWPVEQWYGRPERPSESTPLRAGNLTALFDAPDLRRVRLGEVELVQRIYMAVRDTSWNTIPGEVSDISIEAGERSFEIGFRSRHRYEDMDYEWRALIRGDEDGGISYEMDGHARSSFRYAKIGLLVHHPLGESVGRPYRARTPQGEIRGNLPVEIVPQRVEDGRLTALFPEYDLLAIELAGGGEIRFEFEGDLWEMQDHRNWTDANFKSYGTPMSVPFPFDAEPGQRMWQRITLSAERVPAKAPARREAVTVRLGERLDRPLPPIGLQLASHGQPLTDHEVRLLRQLRPDHLRLDLRPTEQNNQAALARALREASQLHARLELALHLTQPPDEHLARLKDLLQAGADRIARVLVYEAAGFATGASCTPPALVRRARDELHAILPNVPVAGGSNLFFAEINRDRPDVSLMDAVVFGVNPQVHASDDTSLAENLEAQAAAVEMARQLVGERQIFVSPVTFIGPNGPYPAGPPEPDGLPGNVDTRQASLFGAAWTVGSLKYLLESGADALTYFETTGWLGLIEREDGPPRPELFLSTPGMAFPLYHVMADLGEWKNARPRRASSDDTLSVDVLAVERHGGLHLLLANLQHVRAKVAVEGLPGRRAKVRRLDDETFSRATSEPGAFRGEVHESPKIEGGRLRLELAPLATVRLDID